jgi:outer membrane immunogenic protein
MRLTISAGLVLAALAGHAEAAGLPSGAPPPVVMLPPSWTGPYVGAHIGGLFADYDSTLGFLAVGCGPCNAGDTASASFGGFGKNESALLGGVQAGWNWQSGAFVFGVEADFSLTNENAGRGVALPSSLMIAAGIAAITEPGADGFNGRLSSSIDWIATARGRLGVTTGSLLFYATGGVAFADTSIDAGYISFVGPPPGALVPVAVSDDTVKVGWTIGAGIEALLTDRLSAKLEYGYADLGKTNHALGLYINDPASTQQYVSLEEKLTFHVVKVGLNYRFGGP